MLGFLPKMSARDAARREIGYGQLDDRGQGIIDGGYNWQDQLGGFLGGYSQEDVEREAQKIRDRELGKEFDTSALSAKAELEGYGIKPEYQGVSGKTAGEAGTAVSRDKGKVAALNKGLLVPGWKADSLPKNPTIGQINQSIVNQIEANKTTAKTKLENKEELERLRIEKDREIARQDTLQQRAENRAFKQDELEFRRAEAMRQDARYAQTQKDKAIAILMSGLGNLGEAFAGMTV
jgi:hypothetical protein